MKTTFIKFFIMVSILLSDSVVAEDYHLTLDNDPYGIQNQIQTMDDGITTASKSEHQNRMGNMGQTYRESQFSAMGASGVSNRESMNQGSGSRRRDGSGGGGQKRTTHSAENDNSQYRYGQKSGTDGSNTLRTGGGQGRGNRYGMGSR